MQIYMIILFILSSCSLAPKYQKPEIETPQSFKESGVLWVKTNPSYKEIHYDNWIFALEDKKLCELVKIMHEKNYTLKISHSAYMEALYSIKKAQVAFVPSVSSSYKTTESKQFNPFNGGTFSQSLNAFSNQASWEVDLWGNLSSNLKIAKISKEQSMFLLSATKLSLEANLAKAYFNIRILDKSQIYFDNLLQLYEEQLSILNTKHKNGLITEKEILGLKNALYETKIKSHNNKITRSQLQHFIAVLLGDYPSSFEMPQSKDFKDPILEIKNITPSSLLERRPDILAQEMNVAIANEQIGVAKSVFFPSFNFTGNATRQGLDKSKLTDLPIYAWSVGPSLGLNLTNILAYNSVKKAAIEQYNQAVYNYKQTVLNAFMEVEDALVSINLNKESLKSRMSNLYSAQKSYNISLMQYKHGVIEKYELLNSNIEYLNAQILSLDSKMEVINSYINVIKAFGGGL